MSSEELIAVNVRPGASGAKRKQDASNPGSKWKTQSATVKEKHVIEILDDDETLEAEISPEPEYFIIEDTSDEDVPLQNTDKTPCSSGQEFENLDHVETCTPSLFVEETKQNKTSKKNTEKRRRIAPGSNVYSGDPCPICRKRITSPYGMESHMRIHTGKTPNQCSVCSRKFCTKSGLDQHMNRHTGERPYKCTLCDRLYVSSGSLSFHMKKHREEKSFICKICQEPLATQKRLDFHMKSHTYDERFQCTVCEKRLGSKQALKVHMKIHTGEKPFKCTQCLKTFSLNFHLLEHMTVHTGESPYKCHICLKALTSNHGLKRHLLTQHPQKSE